MHSFSRLTPLRNHISKSFASQKRNFCFMNSEVIKKDSFDAYLQVKYLFNKLRVIQLLIN